MSTLWQRFRIQLLVVVGLAVAVFIALLPLKGMRFGPGTPAAQPVQHPRTQRGAGPFHRDPHTSHRSRKQVITTASGQAATTATSNPPPVAKPAAPAGPMVVVHVAGLVLRPDVYTLPAAFRVIDAVRMAGGPRPGADLDSVNLAAHLEDGEQIYVPSRQAVVTQVVLRQPAPVGRMPLAGPLATLQSRRTRSGAPGASSSSRSNKLTDPSQGTVDLNTAGPDELVRLPGVGPSTAQKILEFRQANGRFTSPEDVMNVKGIGPAKFAKMKPFLVVR